MFTRLCHGWIKGCFNILNIVSILLISLNPTIHCPWEVTPLLYLVGNNFDFFLLGLIPNSYKLLFFVAFVTNIFKLWYKNNSVILLP